MGTLSARRMVWTAIFDINMVHGLYFIPASIVNIRTAEETTCKSMSESTVAPNLAGLKLIVEVMKLRSVFDKLRSNLAW